MTMQRLLGAAAAPLASRRRPGLARLTYCVEGAYPPFSQVAPDGSIVGFDIDIGMALCKQMGETCTLVKVDWDGIIPALLEKKCDAIMASMSATEERKQVIDFSAKYYQVPNRFVAKAGTDWSTRPRAWPARSWASSAAPSTRPTWRRTIPTPSSRSTAPRTRPTSTSPPAGSTR